MITAQGKFKNTIILIVVPPKFWISIVFNFSRDLQSPQEKLKTKVRQNFGGATKSIMVFLRKTYFTGTPTNGLMCCLLLLRPRSQRPSAAELLTDPFVVDRKQ